MSGWIRIRVRAVECAAESLSWKEARDLDWQVSWTVIAMVFELCATKLDRAKPP